MKALVIETPGPIADLRPAIVYIPKPGKGEVRVRVMAAGLNPVDSKRCLFEDADFPCILGADVAGVVVELGPEVTTLRVGDRVHFHANVRRQYGGFAEYSVTTAVTAVPIPPGITFTQAAAVPCSGWTAYLALHQKLQVRRGQSILITGASGGVGCFAVQLAKLSGLRVFARTQPHKAAFVRALGADHILPTNEGEETALQAVLQHNQGQLLDHALDTVGATSAASTLGLLKLHGALCSLATVVHDPLVFAKGISLHYVNIGGMHQAAGTPAALAQLGRDFGALLANKQLRVPVMETCTLEQVPVALETLRRGQVTGKLVAAVVPEALHEDTAASLTPVPAVPHLPPGPPPPQWPSPPPPAAPMTMPLASWDPLMMASQTGVPGAPR